MTTLAVASMTLVPVVCGVEVSPADDVGGRPATGLVEITEEVVLVTEMTTVDGDPDVVTSPSQSEEEEGPRKMPLDAGVSGSETLASSPPAPSKSAFTFLNPLAGFAEILLIVIQA